MSAIDLTREVELRSQVARLEAQLREAQRELMEEAAIREDLERENSKLRRVVRRVVVDD